MRRFGFLLLAFAAALGLAAPGVAQDRFAVVAGVENYADAVGAAPGALDDARHVAAALREEGFTVSLLENPNEATLKRSVVDLTNQAAAAGDDATAVFYFVGQGVQINGGTYLLPVDGRTSDDLAVSGSALAASHIVTSLNGAEDASVVIAIDAASPNNLTARFALEPGLGAVDAPQNGIVIFSQAPDEIALPRQPGVSVFAQAFANLVHNEASSFDSAVSAFRAEITDTSAGSRYAWVAGSLSPLFTLSDRSGDRGPAGALDEADDSRSLAAPTPMPSPPAAAPSRGLGAAAAETEAAVEEQIHYVQVYFGTDRVVETNRNGEYEFTARTAPELTYGMAEVSIPPKHEAGQLESPRWWRLEFRPNPERHVVYNGATLMDEDPFFADLRDTVQRSERKQAFVFVHGFNTPFTEAARRTAQMHHDLAFDGAPIFYSWPSEGAAGPLAYNRDGNAALRTAPKLEQFLMDVADRTGAEQIHLIAHSMGNRALVEALDEIAETLALEGRDAPFNQIILSAPDIDRDVFMNVAEEILPTAQRLTLYASANDQALQVSRQINGNPRAGDVADNIVIVSGMNTIDASEVKTELFDLGHDYFATDASILEDIRELFETNAEPAERGLEERHVPQFEEEYWVILRDMFGGR